MLTAFVLKAAACAAAGPVAAVAPRPPGSLSFVK